MISSKTLKEIRPHYPCDNNSIKYVHKPINYDILQTLIIGDNNIIDPNEFVKCFKDEHKNICPQIALYIMSKNYNTEYIEIYVECVSENDKNSDFNFLLSSYKYQNIETAFSHACANGHFEIVKLLYSSSETIDCDAMYNEALNDACENNHADIIRYLVNECNSDFSFDDYYAAKTICSKGNINLIKLLMPSNEYINFDDVISECFSNACYYGQPQMVNYLLGNYSNVIDDDIITNTFVLSCSTDHVKILNILLSLTPSIVNNYRVLKRAFSNACKYGYRSTLEFLVQLDINLINKTNLSQIYKNFKNHNRLESLQFLYSLDIKLDDYKIGEILKHCGAKGLVNVVEFFVSLNIIFPKNALNKMFIAACKYDQINIIEYIVSNGISNLLDIDSDYIFTLLLKSSNEYMIKYVIDNLLNTHLYTHYYYERGSGYVVKNRESIENNEPEFYCSFKILTYSLYSEEDHVIFYKRPDYIDNCLEAFKLHINSFKKKSAKK